VYCGRALPESPSTKCQGPVRMTLAQKIDNSHRMSGQVGRQQGLNNSHRWDEAVRIQPIRALRRDTVRLPVPELCGVPNGVNCAPKGSDTSTIQGKHGHHGPRLACRWSLRDERVVVGMLHDKGARLSVSRSPIGHMACRAEEEARRVVWREIAASRAKLTTRAAGTPARGANTGYRVQGNRTGTDNTQTNVGLGLAGVREGLATRPNTLQPPPPHASNGAAKAQPARCPGQAY
jgi:hypothetical protein